MVAEGKIGRLQYIYSRRLSLGKIRREENILWSFAPHDISLILSIVGEDPSYVDAVGSNFLHASIADVTMTNLKFPSGIGAHVFVSWLNPFKEQRLVVVGSQGMLVFDDTQPVDEKLILYPHTINWKNGLPIAEKAEAVTVGLSAHWEEPLKAECRAFIKAITTGQQPFTSGEEGLRVLHVLELSQKSMKEKEGAITPSTSVKTANSHLSKDVFVHETAIIDDGVRIGKGAKIWHFSHVLSGSTMGEHCNIGQNVVIGPDVAIGDRCKIQNNVSVYKGVTLEDGVFCGPSMVFTNIYNPRAEISKMDQVRPTLVKKGATLGANSTIVCGHTIGSYAFVGAGAVITKDVPDHALMVGNPAKQMGWACVCGERLTKNLRCAVCKKSFKKNSNGVTCNNWIWWLSQMPISVYVGNYYFNLLAASLLRKDSSTKDYFYNIDQEHPTPRYKLNEIEDLNSIEDLTLVPYEKIFITNLKSSDITSVLSDCCWDFTVIDYKVYPLSVLRSALEFVMGTPDFLDESITKFYWDLRANDIHESWGEDPFDYAILGDVINYIKPSCILDIGCGSGRLFNLYSRLKLTSYLIRLPV